jgi:membrane-bound ClpP family serine protease
LTPVRALAFNPVGSVAACAAGIALITFGFGGFAGEFTDDAFTNAVLGGVAILWGVILFLVVLFPYGFGIRLFLGSVAFTLLATVLAFDSNSSATVANDEPQVFLAAALLWFGCYCFSATIHVRHRRKRKRNLASLSESRTTASPLSS